jgi:pantothenate synthetase
MDADLAALELSPTDLVFIPNTHDIYPDNAVFNQDEFAHANFASHLYC